jgi:hypothetical protein
MSTLHDLELKYKREVIYLNLLSIESLSLLRDYINPAHMVGLLKKTEDHTAKMSEEEIKKLLEQIEEETPYFFETGEP